ncbi:hypothetical protein GGQ87_001978 [Brevundimonas alba]|uniref:Uncharacterized protein n=1 Tax=Brevundimonas alba TaxID=74314 RepID=A0A7X6BPF4_9CAUL|nr:hypothetical protein [Brevundimonas alba]NJC41720.1 hypothetical protein [Brevundimonas alba]
MIEPPETPQHVVKGHRSTLPWFDMAMAVGVMAMSFGSLFVSLHTGHTMERLVQQNERLVYAQSTPILQFSTGNNDDGQPVLQGRLTNVGSGAARVVWIRFTNGSFSFVNWQEVIRRLNGGKDAKLVLTAPIARTILSAGEERTVFQWARPTDANEARVWEALNRERWNTVSAACFCSLFDECWTSKLGGDTPVRVESCEVPRPLGGSHASH